MAEDVRVISTERLDAHMQGVLLRTESLARKVVQSMIAVSGGGPGGGGSVVVGSSPLEVRDLGDGIGSLTIVGSGATITPNGDGSFRLTITGGATA